MGNSSLERGKLVFPRMFVPGFPRCSPLYGVMVAGGTSLAETMQRDAHGGDGRPLRGVALFPGDPPGEEPPGCLGPGSGHVRARAAWVLPVPTRDEPARLVDDDHAPPVCGPVP